MARNTVEMAWAWPRALAACAVESASARTTVASACPAARSTAACFSPSAVRIADCLAPSADRIAARLSRSARICFSMESWMDVGGSIAFSSTRLTRRPHLPVASSSSLRSSALIWSREVSVVSRSIPPTTFRSVVTVSCSTAAT
jgi:hypothetical protein